jgi:hypothetical protein
MKALNAVHHADVERRIGLPPASPMAVHMRFSVGVAKGEMEAHELHLLCHEGVDKFLHDTIQVKVNKARAGRGGSMFKEPWLYAISCRFLRQRPVVEVRPDQ